MKKHVVAGLLAATLMGQLGMASFAENGPWTTDYPVTWGIVSLPFRVTTGAVGVTLGTVTGGVKGIVDTEKKFAENTFAKADENPLMVPVGLVGSAVAIPVGFLMGAPAEAVEGGKKGYMWWNRF